MIQFNKSGFLTENCYNLTDEPKHAALFTTGNGYMGIRGSFEEFGSSRIQGAYIRGLIDEIVEVMEPFPDNEYMKKYYFDEQALKDFETQDSCINFADFLLVRFYVNNKLFTPWEGKILKWERYLDVDRAVLVRKVDWCDDNGNETRFCFERFASYADEHLYVMCCSAQPLNHKQPITVVSGIDKKVRTGGQRIIIENEEKLAGTDIYYRLTAGKKYGFGAAMSVHSAFKAENAEPQINEYNRDGVIGTQAVFSGGAGEITLVKTIWINTTRDEEKGLSLPMREIAHYRLTSYEELLKEHCDVWKPLLRRFDIKIEGDAEADSALRFSNYHTIISACLSDSVHGLSAKSLSGERYNQFVWWDAEIYQLPIFRYAYPQIARLSLNYRYKQLNDARENAREQGYCGARFPFVSSVGGKEKIWKYARHPHLQIHITADVGYSAITYYLNTGDDAYLREEGYELISEVLRYWISRATQCGNRYEILNVTGTDEHHPYVDNDAYTNYLVKFIFDKGLKLFEQDSASEKFLGREEREQMRDFAEKLYLPLDDNGMIPQFDGYFQLSRSLETAGNGTGKNFQMKQSGLYHESQVIKQPDVALLYSYINAPLSKKYYAQNWDYYEVMCESSSSLSFAPHAICSADNGRMLSFQKYFMQTVRVDIDDLFHCAWQGIHAGCAAGGYFAVLRGLFGIHTEEGYLSFCPVRMPFWTKVSLPVVYRGRNLFCVLTQNMLTVKMEGDPLEIRVNGAKYLLKGKKTFTF